MVGEPNPRIRWRTLMRLHLTPIKFLPRLRDATLGRSSLRPYIQHKTASKFAILLYGKTFVETFPAHPIPKSPYDVAVGIASFESGLCIGIYPRVSKLQSIQLTNPIAQIKLGFSRDAVVIEAIQGKKGMAKLIMQVNKDVGEPWPNYLLKEVETHARACGFKRIRIRRPEKMHYYKLPAFPDFNDPTQVEKLRRRMRQLYSKAAEARGFTTEKDFFVKNL